MTEQRHATTPSLRPAAEVFVRTDAQRLQALKHANEIRFYRAALKRRLTRATAVGVLTSPPAEVTSMKASALLAAVPGWGKTKVRKALLRAAVSDTKTVGGLSSRQRRELIEVLSEGNDRRPKLTLTGASGGRQEGL